MGSCCQILLPLGCHEGQNVLSTTEEQGLTVLSTHLQNSLANVHQLYQGMSFTCGNNEHSAPSVTFATPQAYRCHCIETCNDEHHQMCWLRSLPRPRSLAPRPAMFGTISAAYPQRLPAASESLDSQPLGNCWRNPGVCVVQTAPHLRKGKESPVERETAQGR